METYEIVNPSDSYTFEAPDRVIATTVALILGGGYYSARSEDQLWSSPFFALQGGDKSADRWYAEHNTTVDSVIGERKDEIRRAMESVVIGSFACRRIYLNAIEAIDDPEKRAAFIDKWNDERRSSTNDIGRVARHYVESMR